MRHDFCLTWLMLVVPALCADSNSIPVKTRAELDKLDAKIALFNTALKESTPKLADSDNKVTTLREKINAAKNPDNVARLQRALDKMEEQQKFYAALIKSQRAEVAELLTKRRLISGAYHGETIAERNAILGVDDGSRARAERQNEEKLTRQRAESAVPLEARADNARYGWTDFALDIYKDVLQAVVKKP
ncbi:MAG TPA: hypothetical protein VKX17_19560 [Planctomycetota bacterium]|nr:hypothetical protein [Planctomycetota bacterium]